MEQNVELCSNCSKPLPSSGFFCGGCLIQFKCKSCNAVLGKDNIGCVICGTPIETKADFSNGKKSNSFRVHETLTERTIEANFSDTVGKDLAGIIKDAYSARLGQQNDNYKELGGKINQPDLTNRRTEDAEVVEQQDEIIVEQKKPVNEFQFPSLKLVATKNLPGSETEWIVVYAFYASNFGEEEKIINREDFLEMYKESGRFEKDATNRTLSKCITRAVEQGYINILKGGGYSLFDVGITKAKEIISRVSGSISKIPKKSAKSFQEEVSTGKPKENKGKKSSSTKLAKRLTDLDFYPNGKENLKVFFKKYPTKTDNDRNTLFVYYLKDILQIDNVTIDHIYTCYDELGLRLPINMIASVNNTSIRTGWINISNMSDIYLTTKGKNQIRFWNNEDN